MFHKTQLTSEKINQRLKRVETMVYRRQQPLPPFRYHTLPEPLSPGLIDASVDDSGWETIAPMTYWGPPGVNFMLRTTFEVPSDWPQEAKIALFLPLGNATDFSAPETLVYLDGVPLAAGDRHHQEIWLPASVRDGKTHRLALQGWTGRATQERLERGAMLFMGNPAVVEIDQPTRDYVTTMRVAIGVAQVLDNNNPAKDRLLNALNDSVQKVNLIEPLPTNFYPSVQAAHETLQAGIAAAGAPLDVTVMATGHAHIDVAWLWTVDQTRRKAQRTFHTALHLMDEFPDYHFTQSQPQLYSYIKQDDPELFAAIQKRVAEGRWEVTGNTWVEPDCNITGPESLVRQFILGKGFVRDNFGKEADNPVLWLPDVFGFGGSLPQLIKQAGVDYFMTIKLGWNRYNRMPYDSFWWQGIDGSRVLAHFSTTPDMGGSEVSTYNASATPEQIVGTWTTFSQKELDQPLLMAYGYGDGGGGPTREMLENIRAMANFPSAPHVQQASIGDFFRAVEQTAGADLPSWIGELYLEYHRGTYTSQSRTKRANRKSEFLMHDAEFLGVLASVVAPNYSYPTADMQKAWELICLNQFHDILPGSSIGQVYVDAAKQYEQVRETALAVSDAALSAIASTLGGDLLLANPTSFSRDDLAFWPEQLPAGQAPAGSDGKTLQTQAVEGGTLIQTSELAPYSVTPLRLVDSGAASTANELSVSEQKLENALLRVEFNAAGDITSIFDKAQNREVLAVGAVGAQWQAFEDRPLAYEAWDIDIYYEDKMYLADPASAITVVESGPLRATLEIKRRILNSDYTQRVSLCANSSRLDFDTKIDWRERRVLLKAAFPVDILATNATYEIQFGNIERPTHRNTSWDWARFEVPAHKWVDLSESDYGVSLLNDCKYGHDIHNNVIRISLLKSPASPDPDADKGEHSFTYSLLPHAGSWRATTIPAAYALNDPIIVQRGNGAQPKTDLSSLVRIEAPNVVIETIKPAEDGRGLIVRFYEAHRRRNTVTLQTAFNIAQAYRSNIIEEDQEELESSGNSVSIKLHPYEIVTLRLVPAR